MTVDGMRRVDRVLGVPLCFLLSLAERLAGRLWQRPRPERIRKILFVQLSEMGSSISAYSALLKARELCPGAELHYFIFEEMQDAIRLLEVVPEENIHTVRSRSAGMLVRDCLRAVLRLRRLQIDAVLDLELFSRASALLSYLFGCPVRVGFDPFHMEGLYRGSLQTHPVIYNHTRHISRNFLALALALTGEPGRQPLARAAVSDDDIRVPQRRSSPAQCARMRTRVQSLCPGIDSGSVIILLNPNSSALLPLRRWPQENYIALARRLLEHPRVHVLVTGAAEEEAEAARLCAVVGDARCVSFCGQTTLPELLDLYWIADLLISNDSGPPNFATLTRLPVLVLFGPETPQCYQPLGPNVTALYAGFLCSPCVSAYNHRTSPCRDNRCLQAISVETVYHSALERLPRLGRHGDGPR